MTSTKLLGSKLEETTEVKAKEFQRGEGAGAPSLQRR